MEFHFFRVRWWQCLTLSFLILGGVISQNPPTVASESVSFNTDVLPILSDKCFHCHGPDATNQDSEFRLDTREHAIADLGGYFGVSPGDLDESELHRRIRTEDADQMPPPEAVRQLTDREKDILDAWILDGAPYEAHWSFQSLPETVVIPEKGKSWSKGPIDRFVYAGLCEAGMKPNQEADKEAWLRRVTFDLTGLPPTISEISAFLADDRKDARRRVVDDLLSREACAERLATEWLDVARYSDSFGYQRDDPRFVWPWRDWVIDAFRQNMPYDQFITWQLAGDLMPDATVQQRLATTFNRLHSHKKEGGVAVEEFRVENVADRTHTVAAAFMGLTFECSRCHDHKYDPITMKDYYGLSSFFANIDENGLISYFTDAVPTPAMPLPDDKQAVQLAEAQQKVLAAETELDRIRTEASDEFQDWLGSREPVSEFQGAKAHISFDEFVTPNPHDVAGEYDKNDKKPADLSKLHGLSNSVAPENQAHTPKANSLAEGRHGQSIQLTGDDPVEIPDTGLYSRDHPFSVALWLNTSEVEERAVVYRRSRGWDDAGSIGYELTKLGGRLSAKLVHFWPGNALCVETDEILVPGEWYHVAVTYDGSSKAAGLRIFINGQPANSTVVQDHLTRQITDWRGGEDHLAIGSRYRDRGFKDGRIDEFFVFDRTLSDLEVRHLFDGESLNNLLARSASSLTADERDLLFDYFCLTDHAASAAARENLRTARQQWNKVMDATPAITIMREQATPRPAYILERGGYDSHGEQISADSPEFLPPFPEDQPRNRLGLARWLTSPDHPLTARVTVNRYWQMMFGKGLVRTPEDFGRQGQRPTHPKLLDWLSRDFIDHGWDVHRLLRQMALSATYGQSAVVSPEVRNRDPENRLLARSFDNRLSAEMIRDNVLAVSGLLSDQIGGPPAKPYEVSLSYKPTEPDKGDGLYRRSLYTFWQRTSPAPVMTTLNANKRDVCRLRREVAPSPLQALVMLNGTQFVEAARVYAANLLKQYGDDHRAMIQEAYLRMSSFQPTEKQLEILSQLFLEQLEIFEAKSDSAQELLAVGNAPSESDIPAARHAAATVLVNAMMNLDECVRLQ